ncbi:hypothetical protein EC840_10386 [Rahnella sp. JUb53]|nr:hypothetical protein EC840_10386 [Rahnella sp. JUb53]
MLKNNFRMILTGQSLCNTSLPCYSKGYSPNHISANKNKVINIIKTG